MNGRKSFSKEKVTEVFRKAKKINEEDPYLWRQDRKGRMIYRPAYGDIYSNYGWNIHHIDGNLNNNNINNLEAVHYDTHNEIHR